jgi:ribosomal protein L11 methyltransferase
VEDRLALYLSQDKPNDLRADVVVANILAGPLREMAPLIGALPKTGGLLGLSGILASQAASVAAAYADRFQLDPVAEKEEWCRITGRRL